MNTPAVQNLVQSPIQNLTQNPVQQAVPDIAPGMAGMPGQQTLPLADIIQPDPVGLWPLAPGWWLLMVISIALLTALVILLRKYLQARKLRTQALSLLDGARQNYQAGGDASDYCRDINQVLKRYWRHYNSDPAIMTADGDRWVTLLNHQCSSIVFHERLADALAHGPYRKIARLNPDVIDQAARQWISKAPIRKLRSSPHA